MATSTISGEITRQQVTPSEPSPMTIAKLGKLALSAFASLRLTVALFALSIVLILIGTLAQVDHDMWEVLGTYFVSWFALVEFQVFLPRTWFPNHQNLSEWLPISRFPFPGGMSIGVLLFANLMAAHLVRFKIQARGIRLVIGLAVLGVGAAITTLIIISGHNHEGLQGTPPFSWSTLWLVVKLSLIPLWVATMTFGYQFFVRNAHRKAEAWILGIVCGLFTLGIAWVILGGEASRIDDSGMRILWQLILGLIASVSLLIGCILVFQRRGGIVLIHVGVGLLMLGQLFVNTYDKEQQITLIENERANFARDIRSIEMAIVTSSTESEDSVISIPLTAKGQETPFLHEMIRDSRLPFDIRVLEFMKNSELRRATPSDENKATAGEGKFIIAEKRRGSGGASSNNEVDMSAAYVAFHSKESGDRIAVHMLPQEADIPEQITVNGTKFDVFLRFAREYKPYSIELQDVRKDDYIGTSTPRNYSSDIRLVDPTRNVDTTARIWMNNPLRFAGETFYQSNYRQMEDGSEATTLQVVRNTGWMIPYVACMLVMVGLVTHFCGVLAKFLGRLGDDVVKGTEQVKSDSGVKVGSVQTNAKGARRGRGQSSSANASDQESKSQSFGLWSGWVLPLALPIILGGAVLIRANRPPTQATFDFDAFGQLPLLYQGRAEPFDTLARTSLRMISTRETFRDEDDKSQPAIRWLLDTITGVEAAENHRVFRIDNLDVLNVFGLERRKGFLYSATELRKQIDEFERQVGMAREQERDKGGESLSVFQRKLLEVDQRIRVFTMLLAAFRPPQLPPIPTMDEFNNDRPTADRKLEDFRNAVAASIRHVDSIKPPLSVPVQTKDEHGQEKIDWQSYSKAWTLAYVPAKLLGQNPDSATTSMNAMLVSYGQGDHATFNREVATFTKWLKRNSQLETTLGAVGFEASFNRMSLFYICRMYYIMMFAVAAFGLLFWAAGWSAPFNRSAFWIGMLTLTIHTAALVGRIWISGRPPVTNLYSSAIYIGWACVVACLIIEAIFRLGIGNLLAAVLGFTPLLIAEYLALDGDTFTVLQAVLDTQFWLATHVVCISTGYSTTFLAGFLGIAYILAGVLSPALSGQWNNWSISKLLATMIYGIVCFSLTFSFFGTVLGGLWADDSWGRFWGWDPKENGALIIVLWNALILHARWGGMVRDRGLAVLAVVGNIVTSWSWFGVNELGVGLHSYGFTQGVLFWLGMFMLSQLLVMALAALPRSYWLSFRAAPARSLS